MEDANQKNSPVYKRVILKLSGEALRSNRRITIDPEIVGKIADEIQEIRTLGVEIGIVIGGGNIFRGFSASARGMDRVMADHMGMLATIINSIALQDFFISRGMPTRVMSAIRLESMAEFYIRRRALNHLINGNIVVFAAGTGNPYFTTDTAAALRASELDADAIIKGTKVDGVYSDDPVKVKNAKKYDVISYDDVIRKNLRVMDATAITLCRENNIPIVVCKLLEKGNLKGVVMGQNIGTIVKGETND